ncbi:dimethylamine:corrinoid methyltransferase [Desulfacinum infernum DSM 9756]|uniref:Dimethylamine:corrinoid methyltransferase n=1 Tax=Desulfacinum infernum DSM 9756 TaxID=1121391 RepID=A0A1M5CFM8_9BACT|nr:dimethylamine:corrinoid methyltransferase [Desulfacinum infernum DSM 9756]
MSQKILTRMGDGERLAMDAQEIRDDIRRGTAEAARRAGVPELTEAEQEELFAILAEPGRIVSVEPGREVIVTDDGCSMSFYSGQDGGGVGAPLSRLQAVLTYERACGADTTSMGHSDYSYKPVKPIINFEANDYYNISQVTTAPFLYGAQPNMGLYFQPDGPCANAAELMPLGKIDEARAAQEEACEHLRRDLVFVGRRLAEVGLEGLNFDTCGSAGDADYLAALQAVEELKKDLPDLPIIMGGAGEFVLGMHGGVEYQGRRLAGLYPHEQVKVAEAAGVDIYGVAVSTATTESVAWNLARAVTFVKAASEASSIPVHANVGMGVCGVPMMEQPPIDAVTRVSKALVQIGKADGL